MTPVRDSDEWRSVQSEVRRLAVELSSLVVEVRGLKSSQEWQKEAQNQRHSDNQEKIQAVEEKVEEVSLLLNGDGNHRGIVTQLEIIHALSEKSAERSRRTGIWVRWGIPIIISLLGLLFGEAIARRTALITAPFTPGQSQHYDSGIPSSP